MNNTLERNTFLLLLLLTSLAFGWVLNPFFTPIFWACVIALLFHPLHQELYVRFGERKNIAALATLGICLIMVIMPTTLVVSSLVGELYGQYSSMTENGESLSDQIENWRESFPELEARVEGWGFDVESIKASVQDGLSQAGEFLARHSLTFGQNAIMFFLNLALMLYLAFFLIRDGDKIVKALLRAIPLSEKREQLLAKKFSNVVRATIRGNIFIALIEGALGGLILWVLGIGNPLLWASAMVVASLLPVVGAGLVWGPITIYLVVTGDYVRATILALFGMIVIGLVDNFLRPILVGRETKLPDYIILFSTIGGLYLFGVNGFVLGPLIAALFVALWQIFIQDFDTCQEDSSAPVIQTSSAKVDPPGRAPTENDLD